MWIPIHMEINSSWLSQVRIKETDTLAPGNSEIQLDTTGHLTESRCRHETQVFFQVAGDLCPNTYSEHRTWKQWYQGFGKLYPIPHRQQGRIIFSKKSLLHAQFCTTYFSHVPQTARRGRGSIQLAPLEMGSGPRTTWCSIYSHG